MSKGSVIDMDETVRASQAAVRLAGQAGNVAIEGVFVGVSGEHIALEKGEGKLTLSPPMREITVDDVRRALDSSRHIHLAPDQEVLEVLPRCYSVDGRNGVTQPVGLYGTRLEVTTNVAIGGSTNIQNVVRAVEKANLEVMDLVLEPIAHSEALLDDSQRGIGTALVDIGGGSCEISVFEAGSLAYLGVIPVGGKHVTNDICKLLKTSPEEAERLKLAYGSTRYQEIAEEDVVEVHQIGQPTNRMLRRKMLCEIIQSRMWELFEFVRRHLERSGRLGVLPGGIVLTGGGAKLEGARKLASDVISGLPVRIGTPRGLAGIDMTINTPEWVTAVGLAQQGILLLKEEELGGRRGDWLQTIRRKLFARDR
jgi:cell division protein FtsA